MSADTQEAPVAVPTTPRRWSRSTATTAAAVLLVLTVVLGYAAWWSRPGVFGEVGNGFRFSQTTQSLRPVTVDMVQRSIHEDSETVELAAVSPRVRVNTANALITFAVCRREQEPFMSADGPASRVCEATSAVEGAALRLTPEATETITMTVTPRRAGRVVVRGMDVAYARGGSHLWQRGTEATGPVVVMRVRP